MGGENRETRLARSRAGLLQSARDFHLVFVTFGALQSVRNFAPLFVLLGTAIETHVAIRSLLAEYGHSSNPARLLSNRVSLFSPPTPGLFRAGRNGTGCPH